MHFLKVLGIEAELGLEGFTLELQRFLDLLRIPRGQCSKDLDWPLVQLDLVLLLVVHVRMPGLEPDAFSLED